MTIEPHREPRPPPTLTIKLSTTMSRTAEPMGAWNDMRPEALCRAGGGS